MLWFTLYRLLLAIPVLFTVITVTFFMVRLAPGGPFASKKSVIPAVQRALDTKYNLDQPIVQQYLSYLGDLVQGDFGPSFNYPGWAVQDLIASGLPVTAELGFYAVLVAMLLGISTGVFAAMKPNSWQDYVPMSVAMIGLCIPNFLLGPLLVLLFSVQHDLLPVSGWGDLPGDKILPSITLGAAYASYLARLTRASMLDVLSQDYIRTARAKGLPEHVVVTRHGLRAGLLPVVAYLGPAFAGLLSGSFVVESIFQIPGLGRFYVQAVLNRDYTMILGTTIFLCVLIVVLNLLSDLLASFLNPQLRRQMRVGR